MAKTKTPQAPQAPEGETPPTPDESGAPALNTEQHVTDVVPEQNSRESDAAEKGEDSQTDQQDSDEQQQGTPDAPYGLKSDGTPAAKRGPKPKSASDERDKQRARLRSVTPTTAKPKKVSPVEVTPLAVVNYQAMGESVASMFFHSGELVLGEEWAPDVQKGEHLAVAGAFRDYFKSIQARDLPPGIALCFVLGIYTLKRATKPTIKGRLVQFGLWVKSKMPKKPGF